MFFTICLKLKRTIIVTFMLDNQTNKKRNDRNKISETKKKKKDRNIKLIYGSLA